MQTLNLTKRPAKIGKSVNTRTEMHGEEEVSAQDIPLTGIVLNNLELAAVTDEETAGTGFFKMDGDQYVPRIAALDPQTLSHRFTGALVRVSGGGVKKSMYTNAKIKSIVLVPQTGGLTLMSCTLQVNPQDDDPSAQALINRKISISIKAEIEDAAGDAGEEGDPELPFDHQDSPGDGVPLAGLTPPDPDDDQPHPYRGQVRRQKKAGKKK